MGTWGQPCRIWFDQAVLSKIWYGSEVMVSQRKSITTTTDSPPADDPKSGLALRRRRLWFRLTALAMAFFVFWGIPEAVVRLIDPPLNAYRAIKFGGDENSLKLFVKDHLLHWKLRADAEIPFRKHLVTTDRYGFRSAAPDEDAKVVLCLGDSCTFGWDVDQADTFPAGLQRLLNDSQTHPGTWSVINAGVPGYTSHQVRLRAEQLIAEFHPSVVVVCIGNNEAWPVERSDRVISESTPAPSLLQSVLTHSRFLAWLAESVRPEQPQSFIAPAEANSVPRVGAEEYRENLTATVRNAKESGAQVILLSSPVNLEHMPPGLNVLPNGNQLKMLGQRIDQIATTQGYAAALTQIDALLKREPNHFYLLWIKGIFLKQQGNQEASALALEQSIENRRFPRRCRPSYRQIVQEVAKAEQADFVEVNEQFATEAPTATSRELYVDWCHPSALGHGIIAESLIERVSEWENQ